MTFEEREISTLSSIVSAETLTRERAISSASFSIKSKCVASLYEDWRVQPHYCEGNEMKYGGRRNSSTAGPNCFLAPLFVCMLLMLGNDRGFILLINPFFLRIDLSIKESMMGTG